MMLATKSLGALERSNKVRSDSLTITLVTETSRNYYIGICTHADFLRAKGKATTFSQQAHTAHAPDHCVITGSR